FFLELSPPLPYLLSFPTRRSSDLERFLDFVLPRRRRDDDAIADAPVGHAADRADLAIARLRRLIELGPSIDERRAVQIHPSHARSEEHTSELQSLRHLVCRLLLEK